MRAACAALATAGAVPFSALPLVHLALFCLHSVSPFQAAAPVHERSAALTQEDVCAGGSCGLSALQQRARSTRAAGASKRIISRHTSSTKGRALVELSLEELDELFEKGNHSVMDLFNDAECSDKVEGCDQLLDRWHNCMDIDMKKVPRNAGRSSDPVKFLQYNCRATCGYCGNGNPLHLSELRLIRNDMVDTQLSYAKAGNSNLPEELLGIFWMDERGAHKEGMMCDPKSYYNFNFATFGVGELLFTAGDGAEWNPETKCIRGVSHTGRQGHWTYVNEGTKEGNALWGSINFPRRNGGYFCQVNDTDWKITMMELPKDTDDLRRWRSIAEPDERGFFTYPDWQMSFTMKKKCFGFLRETTLGDSPPLFYPIYRIVDGYGRRTEHWDAYLRFANYLGTKCQRFGEYVPLHTGTCSIGDGTQLTPVVTKSLVPRGFDASKMMEYLRLYDTGRAAKP